jgi:predicted CXXCH cytochrome family protein
MASAVAEAHQPPARKSRRFLFVEVIMPGPAPIFREIHRLRRFAHDLQEQLDRIPRQLKIQQARLARQEQALQETKDKIKHLKVTASDKEKLFKGKHEAIERFQTQLNTAGSKKEYDALQLEIAHAKTECSRLEDEILAALTESEETAARLPEAEKAVKQAREELTKLEAQTGPRKADLEAQLAQTQSQLKKVEESIPADLRPQYNRTIVSLGAEGLAAVRDGVCESCHTEITAQTLHNLKQEMFVLCRSCGRILYLPEGEAAPAPEG